MRAAAAAAARGGKRGACLHDYAVLQPRALLDEGHERDAARRLVRAVQRRRGVQLAARREEAEEVAAAGRRGGQEGAFRQMQGHASSAPPLPAPEAGALALRQRQLLDDHGDGERPVRARVGDGRREDAHEVLAHAPQHARTHGRRGAAALQRSVECRVARAGAAVRRLLRWGGRGRSGRRGLLPSLTCCQPAPAPPPAPRGPRAPSGRASQAPTSSPTRAAHRRPAWARSGGCHGAQPSC